MKGHRYRVKLSVDEIGNLIQELEDYKRNLDDRIKLFVERLAEVGIPVIDSRIMQAQGDSNKDYDTDISVVSSGETTTATLILSGTDVLFIEFPTGIYYNNTVHHPKAAEFGYGIGTYGKGQGLNPGYWWYKGEDDKYHFSRGTECTMPMYSASLEIIRQIETVAKEVFGNG